MILRAAFCCFLLFVGGALRAEEQVRRVQEELRKRNLYFGDVDGRKTAETRGAIRRYQERKGFAATGELSADTLISLNLVPDGKVTEAWPEGTVMKSDVARQIAEADRKLLEEINAGDPEPALATETKPPDRAEPNGPSAPSGAVAKSLIPVGLGPETGSEPPEELAEQARNFVRDYLTACETNRIEAEMNFYADRVQYFDHGNVDRAFVAKDVQRFYRRWPERHYELQDFKLTKTRGEELEMTFRIGFRYKDSAQSVSGRSLNIFRARVDPDGLRFISLKEQRVRE